MLRAISSSSRAHLNSLSQSLTSFGSSSNHFPPLSSPFSSQSSKQKKETDSSDLNSIINRDPESPPRLFVVQPRLRPDTFLQAKLNEALCLANSLEEQRDGYFDVDFFDKEIPPHIVVQNPSFKGARVDTYFGPGTVDAIKCQLRVAESKGEVDAIFVNTILSGIQQRNLERAWGQPVLDRVGLIIEIFNAHAYSKEGKLQAELAALMYKKSRLVRVRGLDGRYTFGGAGEVEVVSARGRGSGGRGFISGAGETELQLQRRRILERRSHLKSQIEEVRRTRALQRAARKRHGGFNGQGLATVAVVGYTNAGKSTLVGALSNSDLFSDSRLFATVDPRLRSVVLPSGRKVLLSDTVGFISDLPVQLVEAFHATLEEVVEADLLVHVVDSTAPNLDEHRSTVFQVLQQIGVTEEKLQNMIEVWNKIDYQEEGMNVIEYHPNDDEVSSNFFEGEEDDNTISEAMETGSFSGQENGQLIDYSDGWLEDEDEDEDDLWGNESSDKKSCSKDLEKVEKDLHSQDRSMPHIRTSAIMGVGLQELLELIDEKLEVADEKVRAQNVVGKGIFERKWRPPREDEAVVIS